MIVAASRDASPPPADILLGRMRLRLNPAHVIEQAVDRALERRLPELDASFREIVRSEISSDGAANGDEAEQLLRAQLAGTEKRMRKTTRLEADRVRQSLSTWHRSVHRRVAKIEELLDRRAGARDERFYEVASAVVEEGRTMLSVEDLYTLWQAVENVPSDGGAWAEVGIYQGGTIKFLVEAAAALGRGEPELHGFDLFDAPPPEYLAPEIRAAMEKKSEAVSVDEVGSYLERFAAVTLHAGDVADTLPALPERSWSLVHIDVNFLEPTLAALRYFAPRVVPGGVVVLDDYADPDVPGVAAAVAEWLVGDPAGWQRWRSATDQLVVVKFGADQAAGR